MNQCDLPDDGVEACERGPHAGGTPGTLTIDQLMDQSRSRLERVPPSDLEREMAAGALVVDIRPVDQRDRDGDLPGAVVIDRNVLEWRLAPSSAHRIPIAGNAARRIVVVCNEGYSSASRRTPCSSWG